MLKLNILCKNNDCPLSDVRSKPDLGKCRLEEDGGDTENRIKFIFMQCCLLAITVRNNVFTFKPSESLTPMLSQFGFLKAMF